MQALADARDRDAWLAARKKGIGASEVAAIMGLSPWGSPIEVWARKTGRVAGIESSERMRWGSRLEAQILAGYAEEKGRVVEACQVLGADEEVPQLLATPDGFDLGPAPPPGYVPDELTEARLAALASTMGANPKGCIETKLTSQAHWGADAPLYYQIQLQVQLAVTGLSWGAVVALHGNELGIYRYDRHEKVIARIRDVVARFWRDHIERDQEPPAMAPADADAVRALHPKDSGQAVILGNAELALVEQWEAAKKAVGQAMDAKKSIEGRLCQALGDATWGALPNGKRLQWKVEPRKAHEVAASEPRVLRLVKGA